MTKSQHRWAVAITLSLAGLLYAVACSLPAIGFSRNHLEPETWPGFVCLLSGPFGVFMGQFAWFANVSIFFAAVMMALRFWKASCALGLLSLLLACNVFTMFGEEFPGDEAGVNKLYMQTLEPGCWVWFASLAVVVVGNIVLWIKHAAAIDEPAEVTEFIEG